MKKKYLVLLAILVTVAFCAAGAEAGWFDKKSDSDDGRAKSHRYDFLPTMSYHLGTLRRDNMAGWNLDESPIHVMSGAKVTENGIESVLSEGRQVIIMGPKVGDTIMAWRVRILEPDWNVSRDTSLDHLVTWSDGDPSVGEMQETGPQ